nr:hypothetical protein [Thiocapsa sp. UBA6158]
MTTLGNSPGFDALAEGVETEAQRRFLLGVDCRRARGHLFSPPVPPEAVVRLLSWLGLSRTSRAVHESVAMGLSLRKPRRLGPAGRSRRSTVHGRAVSRTILLRGPRGLG